MTRTNSRFNRFLACVYADGTTPEGGNNPPPSGAGGGEGDKKFTQEDVNKFLAEDRRKHQDSLKQVQAQLDQFKGTAKEKEALQEKLKDMEKSFLTKEELSKQEQDKLKTKYDTELKTAASERDQWRNLFVNTLANNAITEAAAAHKAFNPAQLQLLLKNQVEVKQKSDDKGNLLNEFDTVMNVPVKDKDGEVKILTLSVKDGVGKMRENPEFANLFLVDGTPGTGATTINNGGNVQTSGGPPDDPDAYRAWRNSQKKAGRM